MTQEEIAQEMQKVLQGIELPDEVPKSPLEADTLFGVVTQAFKIAITQPEQLAIGWWLSAAFIMLIAIALIVWIYLYKKRNRYRKWALAELKTLAKICDDGEFTRASALLLKRTVIHAIDKNAASHFGETWRTQLLHYYPKFNMEAANAISVDQYKRDSGLGKSELYPAVKQWLRHHKRKAYP